MKKIIFASIAAFAIAGSTVVYAQHRSWFHHQRLSSEDKSAFADARIAAVHAGLKLAPDQENFWSPVEAAVRDFAMLRIDRANARMSARQDREDARGPRVADDPVTRLRDRADSMATTAVALKRIADAADPLYKTLDESQNRRLAILTQMGRLFGDGQGFRHRGLNGDDRGNREQGHGDRDRGSARDGDFGPQKERL